MLRQKRDGTSMYPNRLVFEFYGKKGVQPFFFPRGQDSQSELFVSSFDNHHQLMDEVKEKLVRNGLVLRPFLKIHAGYGKNVVCVGDFELFANEKGKNKKFQQNMQ